MTRYILDTDHVTLLYYSNPIVVGRFNQLDSDVAAITVITVEEQIQGWFNTIRKASSASKRQSSDITWAYVGLRQAVQFFNGFHLLDFDTHADHQVWEFRRQGIRIGIQDLRIASIAVVNNLVLVTRNQQDFAQVPELVWEDWTG